MQDSAEGPIFDAVGSVALESRLAELVGSPRPAYVAGVKQAVKDEWARIEAFQREQINEVTGFDVGTMLTAAVDDVVRAFAERALARSAASDEERARFAVFALGGYGRGELSPCSDIDLLVLDCGRGASPEAVIEANRELQLLLWDTGFKVGASMRQPGELERIINGDFVTATAVLEQRLIYGPDAAADTLREIRTRFRKRRAKPFLRYKLEELMERRADLTRGMFMLEPNLKTDPGGLRDVQLLRNVAYVIFGSRNLHALRELDVFTWEDVRDLFAANDHYLGLRALLHFRHDRSQDVLHLTDQLWLAEALGYTACGRLLAVEHMMRLHYAKTLHVHRMVELMIDRLHALGHLGRRRILVKSRRPLGDDFAVIDGRIYLAEREFWGKAEAAYRLFSACRQAQRRGYRLSLQLQRDIGAHDFRLQVPAVREDPRIARLLLEILGDLGRVRPMLEDLHWSGALGAYLPEFGKLTCHMQFNSYHQYTVDQHTLIALGYIDDAVAGRGDPPPLLRRLLARIERPDLLMFALLLHDMGKFMGSGHVERGALMVHDIAERMGLDEIEEDLVHFLVHQHVALSDATRVRDIHDPALLSGLASHIGDQERLDLLYCLTWADASAVGEGIFTGWQQSILDELHDAISEQLRWMTGEGAVSRPQQVRDELAAAGLDEAAIDAYLARLDDGYAYQVQRADVNEHLRLLERVEGEDLALACEQSGGLLRLTVALRDRPHLLADIAALLSGHDFEIDEARVWSTADGVSLHALRVTPGNAFGTLDDEDVAAFERDLRAMIAGSLDPEEMIRRQSRRIRTSAPADSGFEELDVSIDQDSCDDATILDVMVKDRPGLLYLVCDAVGRAGCEITYAAVSTYGDIARDAFYVRREGRKLAIGDATSLREAVRTRLAERFDDGSEHSPPAGVIRM